MSVKVRTRAITGNRLAVYIDRGTKEQRFVSTGIYLSGEKDKAAKAANKEKLEVANKIAAKIEREMLLPEIYTNEEIGKLKQAQKSTQSIFKYIELNARKKRLSNFNVWNATLGHLVECWIVDKPFNEITLSDIDDFEDYLLSMAVSSRTNKPLSHNSAACYFTTFKNILKEAYRGGYLDKDISMNAGSIQPKETVISHLTADELSTLLATECGCPLLKEMAIFSAFTGLRWSDCQALDTDNLKETPSGWVLRFTQVKTGNEEVMPISPTAKKFIPPNDKKPFAKVDYPSMIKPLNQWIKDAGIDKKITFHSFRHSYAMMLLDNNVDLLTVSELLGHKSIRSTQVYAKATNERKRAATNTLSF